MQRYINVFRCISEDFIWHNLVETTADRSPSEYRLSWIQMWRIACNSRNINCTEICSVKGCSNEPNVGAHIQSFVYPGELMITGLCYRCNNIPNDMNFKWGSCIMQIMDKRSVMLNAKNKDKRRILESEGYAIIDSGKFDTKFWKDDVGFFTGLLNSPMHDEL